MDWLNSLSNTSQFVRLGLRQLLEAGLSCSSRKLILLWSDIVSSFETSHACISCMSDPDARVISITVRLLLATKVGSAPMSDVGDFQTSRGQVFQQSYARSNTLRTTPRSVVTVRVARNHNW